MTDEQASADFVRHRAATLYRYGYVLTGNHHDADDLVQDALMTDIDLREGMDAIAAEAPQPPADLLVRVEAGRRRHRRTQAVTAAFATVVVLAAGSWVSLRPAARHQDTPDGNVLLDPVTGKFGVVTREAAAGCRVAYSPIKDVVAYRWASDAGCKDRRVAYVDVGY